MSLTFSAALPQFAGLSLAADETPARNAAQLSPAAQAALLLCLAGDRLDYRRRCGWQRPGVAHPRIYDVTIHNLTANGLMTIINHGRFRKHARLTARGNWYARTLFSDAADQTAMEPAAHDTDQ